MKDYSIRIVYDRKNETGYRDKLDKKKKNGKKYKETGLVQIQVRKEGTFDRAYVSAGVKVRPDQITLSDGIAKVRNHDNAKGLTGKIRDRLREVEIFVSSDKCVEIADVHNWDKIENTSSSIIEFIEEDIKRRNPSYSVVSYNNSFIKRLKEYGKIKNFEDLSYDNIVGLDAHLRKTIESGPTLYKRHSLFKGYIREAINRGIYSGQNPYALFKFRKGKSKDPVFLVENEILLLENYTPNFGYLERTRDMFLFQCYTGLAYIDLIQFSKKSITEVDGDLIIRSNRTKTEENYVVWLTPDAERLAIKYNYDFPNISNQKYNEYLKEIAIGAKIQKKLTSHVARHTFATYLLNKNIPLKSVSSAMGHSSIKQTEHYARLLGKTVISDMKNTLGPQKSIPDEPEQTNES